MQTLNRLTVCIKRILSKKLYLFMLTSLVVITCIYKLLPPKESSADIKIAVYTHDTTEYSEQLADELINSNSLYTFYFTDSEDMVINDVKSGRAECGYIIPENFFTDYINGQTNNKVKQYIIPSTTLGTTINETLFSKIFELCARDILHYSVGKPELNDDLSQMLSYYMESEEIFRIKDSTSKEFNFDTFKYHINMPLSEISIIVILFSGLLGLLIYIKDAEKQIYISLSRKERFSICTITILTAIIPITLTCLIVSLITFGVTTNMLYICIIALASFILSLMLGLIIKKSTLLSKVLPLIMLITITTVFVTSLI